jgi:hypothetical protein
MRIQNRISFYAICFIAVLIICIRLIYHPQNVLSYDVFGYYLYLPGLFIYNDPGLHSIEWVQQINNTYNAAPSLYQIAETGAGNWIIRFNCGMALLFAPFFLLGHLAAWISPYPQDGFSAPYQWAIIISGIFYTLIGLIFMRKVLLRFFDDKITAVTLILLFIGSNVFFFSTMGNDVPHVYIFTLLTLLIWLSMKWHEEPKTISAAGIGLVAGLTSISRTTGILVLLIPVFWGIVDVKSIMAKFRVVLRNYGQVLIAVMVFACVLLLQVLYWKIHAGEFIYNAYDDPQSGFNFSNPRFGYVLFGFRKGFFVYSPMMLFAVASLIFTYRYFKEAFLAIVVFTLANIYLIACYSTLVSYGWRAFIELHAPLAIPLGGFISYMMTKSRPWKIFYSGIFGILILINLLKSYQTLIEVIDGSRMTKEYYFKTFFRLFNKPEDKELLLVERSVEIREYFRNPGDYMQKRLAFDGFENVAGDKKMHSDSLFAEEGKYSIRVDSTWPWSPPIRVPYREITAKDHAWIRANADIYFSDPDDAGKIFLVIDFVFSERLYKYKAFNFNDLNIKTISGQWNPISFDYLTPEVRTEDDLLEVYVWYQGKNTIYVDNLTVDVFEKKDN